MRKGWWWVEEELPVWVKKRAEARLPETFQND
jgi:hypothetical protein